MSDPKIVSVVATVDTDAVADKKGNITKAGTSQQVPLDPKDKAIVQLVEKAMKAREK